MDRVPDAVFITDLKSEEIALREATRLRLPVIALVDSNCDPGNIDHVIPGNDDAIRSCELVISTVGSAVEQGAGAWAVIEEKRRAEEQARREKEDAERKKREEEERVRREQIEKEQAEEKARSPRGEGQGRRRRPGRGCEAASAGRSRREAASAGGPGRKPASAGGAGQPASAGRSGQSAPAGRPGQPASAGRPG